VGGSLFHVGDIMLFCSQLFLVFFAVVFTAYWSIPARWHRGRIWLLLAASFYFYASWNEWLALIIAVSCTVDYFLARGMDKFTQIRVRRFLLVLSVAGNLGLLCYFKYANFFLESLNAALQATGSTSSLPLLHVILPIGISFYTFEAINYTVDVYRRQTPAERDLGHFMLFITFFPHLVAGPIVRARDFLPQIRRPKHWDWARLQLGVQFFLMGMYKKMAIADRMALFVDPVFAEPEAFNTGAVWIAVIAYALQIYCDFSGYTDMALGTAHMLGFKLAQNFNMPYLAWNISEFWRRWHISLSSWLRDYLFIPLGGSHGSRWRTCRNLLITMTLGGLWHGANWTFVLWGVFHGGLLIGHRLFRGFCQYRPGLDRLMHTLAGKSAGMALTFLCVCAGWVLFRATTFDTAGEIFKRLIAPHGGQGAPMHVTGLLLTIAVVMAAHALTWRKLYQRFLSRLPEPALGFGYAAVLLLALVLAPDSSKPFIYFQF
jgi:alginate O-acetyltransferase complex protein AlgI